MAACRTPGRQARPTGNPLTGPREPAYRPDPLDPLAQGPVPLQPAQADGGAACVEDAVQTSGSANHLLPRPRASGLDQAHHDAVVISIGQPGMEPTDHRTAPVSPPRAKTERIRMSGKQRREQLLDVGRKLFAQKGYEAVSVEEIAAKAGVSKPVVYEHFGGKEGLYAVVVDREVNHLLQIIGDALTAGHPRELLEQAGMALFDYIEGSADGFRVLVRDSPVSTTTGNFASLLVDVAAQVEHLLAREFDARHFNAKLAPMYSQMLVGMVALTGQWWLDVRKPKKDEVVAHVVNLAWNGVAHLEQKPRLIAHRRKS